LTGVLSGASCGAFSIMHGIHFIQDLAVVLVVAGLVGWVCQRVGLSVVVGFLVAGIVAGPKSPVLPLVGDAGSIETLAQVGLVFLMFSIGLGLSLRKMRRLGPGLMLATFGGAITMYYLARLLGASLGWSSTEGLFLAGMLMVSSSAIIGKILHETGTNHERSGQLAMGISVLEDVVAVVMLTLLNSMVQIGEGGGAQLGATLLQLGAFVVLTGILGLLLVPWLLKRMSISADEELQTLGLAALLFGMAVVAAQAGYSLALGAFLLGTIVAETSHRHQVERTFAGMRDVFSAVFFVAIGMQIDVRELWASAGLIVGVAVFTLSARPLSVTTGLALIGTPLKDAVRTGLTGTPIGEFSFIIAQLGVTAASFIAHDVGGTAADEKLGADRGCGARPATALAGRLGRGLPRVVGGIATTALAKFALATQSQAAGAGERRRVVRDRRRGFLRAVFCVGRVVAGSGPAVSA
jgi:CPA2 family monovalent cation:H+ antiporter-2